MDATTKKTSPSEANPQPTSSAKPPQNPRQVAAVEAFLAKQRAAMGFT